MSVRVKICGLTNLADAMVAVESGADAVGFLFYDGSPRFVPLAAAAVIVSRLPASVTAVGVFVNPTADQVRRAVEWVGIQSVQFHGEETSEFVAGLELPVRQAPAPAGGFVPPHAASQGARVATIKAFRVRDASSLAVLPQFPTDLWLLDSFVPGQRGGTGAPFDWLLASQASQLGKPIVLAGGLTPENVAEAVRRVQPHAVDVSSGVESSPGRKDHARVRAFLVAAKQADWEEASQGWGGMRPD